MTTHVDWATTEGCARCDEHGPFLPGLGGGELVRDLHQVWHAFVAPLVAPLVPVVEWLEKILDRC